MSRKARGTSTKVRFKFPKFLAPTDSLRRSYRAVKLGLLSLIAELLSSSDLQHLSCVQGFLVTFFTAYILLNKWPSLSSRPNQFDILQTSIYQRDMCCDQRDFADFVLRACIVTH